VSSQAAFGFDTLSQAKEDVKDGRVRPEGIECPCCGQYCKVYKRKLNSAMALALIWLVRSTAPGEFVHATTRAPREALMSRGAFAFLAYWDLAEQRLNELSDKRCSGFWRATERGRDFAYGKSTLWSHALVYDNDVLEFCGDKVDVVDALGRKFNYHELMSQWGLP
jgi:hypothetical protein